MNLTFIEILDLKRLIERIERESKERVLRMEDTVKFGRIAMPVSFTDLAIETSRVLPVLKKVLEPLFLVEKTPAPSCRCSDGECSKEVSRPDAKTIYRRIGVGDTVAWWSQAGGVTTLKRGMVAAVVPALSYVHSCVPDGCKLRNGPATRRDHESYLVKVEGCKTLYWPLTKYLSKEQSPDVVEPYL